GQRIGIIRRCAGDDLEGRELPDDVSDRTTVVDSELIARLTQQSDVLRRHDGQAELACDPLQLIEWNAGIDLQKDLIGYEAGLARRRDEEEASRADIELAGRAAAALLLLLLRLLLLLLLLFKQRLRVDDIPGGERDRNDIVDELLNELSLRGNCG